MRTEKELSKIRKGHKRLHIQSKGRHKRTCKTGETVYRIRNNTPNQWAEVVKLYRQNKELKK